MQTGKQTKTLPIDKMQTMAKAKSLTMNGAHNKKGKEKQKLVQIYVLTTAM